MNINNYPGPGWADRRAGGRAEHTGENSPPVSKSRMLELLNVDIEGTRRDAIALVQDWFDRANRAVPIECSCDADGRICMCFDSSKECYDRLVSEINTSGTIRIIKLVDAARLVVRPNGKIPQYHQIENAVAAQEAAWAAKRAPAL